MRFIPLLTIVILLGACGDDKSPTNSGTLKRSNLDYDWTDGETNNTWSFDRDGRFWFFPGDFDTGSFMGTWSLEGDRITLNADDRGTLILQVVLVGKELTVTRLCDESAGFFTEEQLADCRENPSAVYNRASLFDIGG